MDLFDNLFIDDDLDYDTEDEDIAEESVVFSTKDNYYNLGNWKPGKETNILFVAGHSGAGKTTLGKEIAERYGAHFIELDRYNKGAYSRASSTNGWNLSDTSVTTDADRICKDYYSNKEFNYDVNTLSTSEYRNKERKGVIWLYNYCTNRPNELFVWEGVSIQNVIDPNSFKDKPVIIKGTSLIKSATRAMIRDNSAYQKSTISAYGEQEKQIRQFKKYMDEEGHKTNDVYSSIHLSYASESVSLSQAIPEIYNGKKYYPVYIVLMANKSALGDAIRSFTKEPYSHSSISFDAGMQDLYTFGNKIIKKGEYTKRQFGSAREAFKHDSFKWSYPPNTDSDIYVMFFTEKQVKNMIKTVDDIFDHHEEYKYNISGLIKYIFGLKTKDPHKLFCSQFVTLILSKGRKDLLTRDPSLYSPYGITELRGIKLVDRCTIGTYNRARVEKKTKQIFQSIVKSGDLTALEATEGFFKNIDSVAMESSMDYPIDLPYFTVEEAQESAKVDDIRFETPKELIDWMSKNIKYSEFTKLKTINQLMKTKCGSCHDQALFIQQMLNRMGLTANRGFFIAFKPGTNEGGMTHTFVYYINSNGSVTWVENSWNSARGIRTYKSVNALRVDIFKRYSNMPECKKYPCLEFKTVSGVKPGMNLDQYVSAIVGSNSSSITIGD